MRRLTSSLYALAVVGALLSGSWLSSGCCMPYSQLRDGRTLGEGRSRFAMSATFLKPGSEATAESKDGGGSASTDDLDEIPALPVFQAEYSYGITDRLDIGARFSQTGLMLDLKIGLLQSELYNLAIDPAAGYGVFLVSAGPRVDLPVIFSIGNSRPLSGYVGASVSYSQLAGDLFEMDDTVMIGTTGFAGLSLEFKSIYLRGELAYTRLTADGENDTVTFDLIQPSFLFGVRWGEQIDDLEKRMDKLEKKVDTKGGGSAGDLGRNPLRI